MKEKTNRIMYGTYEGRKVEKGKKERTKYEKNERCMKNDQSNNAL